MQRPAELAIRTPVGESYDIMSDREAKSNVVPLTSEDRSFFARAYREHSAALHKFLRHRVGTDAEAADIAHEAYLRVLRYRNHGDKGDKGDKGDAGAIKALLFRIAMNLLVIRTRIARTRHVCDHISLEDDSPLVTEDPSQDRQIAGAQALAQVLEVVETLPRKCREVFILGRLQGMGRTEVADILHLSPKTVDKHMRKALILCRKKLGEEWT